jgi:hypothetical protein
MKARVVNDEFLLRRLVKYTDESATLAMFIQLCQESPELRHWLWEDFGRDAKVRAKFAKVVNKTPSLPIERFTELTDDAAAWREESRRLREQISPGLYGGLTWNEIAQLIRHYQASNVDLGVFLLAYEWRKAGKSSPSLKWAGLEFLEQIIPSGRRRLLRHLNKALIYFKNHEDKAKRSSLLGYGDRWKLHILFYILRHPQGFYLTRELRAYLDTLGLKISAKEMRRFCKSHGIKRDMLPGRPRTRKTPKPIFAQSPHRIGKHRKHKAG